MARQHGFHRGSSRRRVGWEEGIGQVGVQTPFTGSAVVVVNGALALNQDGLTLVRTRGQLQAFLTAATAVGDGFAGAFGIGVATAAAVVAGAASLPMPITEQSWDGWLFWQAIQIHSAGVVAAGASTDRTQVNPAIAALTMEIDSKAMRKVGIDDAIFGVLELTITGAATLAWRVDSRMLFKLP